MDIDIYDFDKTVVPFDSGSLFWGYCLLHYPWILIFIPIQFFGMLFVLLHIINFTQFKKVFFAFIMTIPLKSAVSGFWNKHEKQVFSWFKNERKRHTVVISASPNFLLEEIQKRIGFEDLLCSVHSPKTGAIKGENCRNQEKINRLYKLYNKDEINVIDVYSDSLKNDQPIFSLATNNCYHIVRGKRIKFDYKKQYTS